MTAINDEFVVSGIAGRFPECDNVEEFWHHLINGIPLCTMNAKRWPIGLFRTQERFGVMKNIENFDGEFFLGEDRYKYACPGRRIGYEVIYEAIWDAGLDPDVLRGQPVSLIFANLNDDTSKVVGTKRLHPIQETAASFGFLGASLEVDSACGSALTGLIEGIRLMKFNMSDSVVVIGCSVILDPAISYGFRALTMNSADGIPKCLDEHADGYTRSESVCALFVQKRAVAKRIHASIVSVATNNDGFTVEGVTFPSFRAQAIIMKDAIKAANIDPLNVKYIEAHATSTPAGDPVECGSIIEAYRGEDPSPLVIGCLKSNLGHTEAASALCSIIKISLIFQTGEIPPNLNFKKANPRIPHLTTGRLIPILHKTKFDGTIIPTNAFGFGGSNATVVLKKNPKKADNDACIIIDKLPRLINICGRTEQQITYTMNWIESNRPRVTKDFLSLLNDVSKIPFESKMNYRGYMIIDQNNNVFTKQSGEKFQRQQLWYIFAGFVPHRSLFTRSLMDFEPFAASIKKSEISLKELGIDLMNAIENETAPPTHSNTVTVVVVTIAVQLAMFDLLSSIGLTADNIVGISLGSITCAIINGLITREDLWEALVSSLEKLNDRGSLMWLKVNSGKEDFKTGEAKYTNRIKNLNFDTTQEQRRDVSKQINGTECLSDGPIIMQHDKSIYSLLVTEQKDAGIKNSSPSMKNSKTAFVFDLITKSLSPKNNFQPVVELVPENACLVAFNVSPKSNSMGSIIPGTSDLISMFDVNESVNSLGVLTVIGQIYNCGHAPEIEKLYPHVEYPVACGTANLSHLLKWNHWEEYFVAKYPDDFNPLNLNQQAYDLSDEEFRFLCDHQIDGKIIFPATGFLVFILEAFTAKWTNSYPCIQFREIRALNAVILEAGGGTVFKLKLDKLTGRFAVTCRMMSGAVCCTGIIVALDSFENTHALPETNNKVSNYKLDQKAIYKELRVRGYDYGPAFQGLVELDSSLKHGKVKGGSHLISVMDSLLHIIVLNQANQERNLIIPSYIGSFTIDLPKLSKYTESDELFDVYYNQETDTIFTEIMFAEILKTTQFPRHSDPNLNLQYYGFLPLDGHVPLSEQELLTLEDHNELCSKLIRSMKASDYSVDSDLDVRSKRFDSDRFAFFKHLKKAATDKVTLDSFIDSFQYRSISSFPISKMKKELVEDQIQICVRETVDREIVLIEVNESENVLEPIATEICRSFEYRCAYNIFTTTGHFAGYSKKADAILYKDITCQLLLGTKLTPRKYWREMLKTCYLSLSDKGFLLLLFRTKPFSFEAEVLGSDADEFRNLSSTVNKMIEETQFLRISTKTDDLGFTSVLLRKHKKQETTVFTLNPHNYDWISKLQEELKNSKKDVCIKAATTDITGVAGLSKSLSLELHNNGVFCVINDGEILSEEVLSKALTVTLVKNGEIGTLGFQDYKEQLKETKHAVIGIATKGDLSSFRWYEAPHKLWDKMSPDERGPKKFLVNVHFSALNFKDIMLATNQIPFSLFSPFCGNVGMEYAGIDENGRRVFGLRQENAFATTVELDEGDYFFVTPDNWTLEQASTVPLVYATAYMALMVRGKLLKNESVLIHSGSGGVGQAAIRLCLSMNCQIFTSVGSEERKNKLKEMFPQLGDDNFVNSRSTSFEAAILKATNGRGVDLVLNSLAEEKLLVSINCVAEGGRLIEIGKYDMVKDTPIEARQRNVTITSFCIARLFYCAKALRIPKAVKEVTELHAMILKGIADGIVQPLPMTTFSADKVEDAFRFMEKGNHFGKIILKIRDENDSSSDLKVMAYPRAYFYPSKVYVIVGGLGGMGLQLAFWLSERGAKNIVVTSRHGVSDSYQKYMIDITEKNGAHVTVMVNSLCDEKSAIDFFENCSKLGNIGGIFNLSLVLHDVVFEEMTVEIMDEVCNSKITITDKLDKMSRNYCPQIDYFVCFSSAVASFGNIGQTNYAYANSAMEMICKRRRKAGFHALAIQWGMVGDVGIYWERIRENYEFTRGMRPQRIFSCLETLETFLGSDHTVCTSTVQTEMKRIVHDVDDYIHRILHILGVPDASKVNENMTLGDLGADSLMVVEIRHTLQKNFNVTHTPQQIRNLSLQDLRNFAKN